MVDLDAIKRTLESLDPPYACVVLATTLIARRGAAHLTLNANSDLIWSGGIDAETLDALRPHVTVGTVDAIRTNVTGDA